MTKKVFGTHGAQSLHISTLPLSGNDWKETQLLDLIGKPLGQKGKHDKNIPTSEQVRSLWETHPFRADAKSQTVTNDKDWVIEVRHKSHFSASEQHMGELQSYAKKHSEGTRKNRLGSKPAYTLWADTYIYGRFPGVMSNISTIWHLPDVSLAATFLDFTCRSHRFAPSFHVCLSFMLHSSAMWPRHDSGVDYCRKCHLSGKKT